jgi:hypothetical protein
MTDQEPSTGVHPLQPELTLACLAAALPGWAMLDPDREGWVEVLWQRLPAGLVKLLIRHLLRDGSLEPDGRARLPRDDWEWLCEQFMTQARSVLEDRNALLLAEAGPSSRELDRSPHIEDWQVMDFGVGRPHLVGPIVGPIVGPLPGEPDAFGPSPLMTLGPGQDWARLLHGWVSLGRRDEPVRADEPRRPFTPRPMGQVETDARMAELRQRIEGQVADLVPPSGEQPDHRFILGLLSDPPRPTLGNEGKTDTLGKEPVRGDIADSPEVLTAAERLVVQVYRVFGAEMPFWLLRRNLWLGQERPVDLLDDEAGRERLAEHLTALEAGVYL